MKLPAYPEYKPSGVGWLGDIPRHWEVTRLKRVARMKAGSAITTEGLDQDGEYPVYGGNGLRGYTSTFTHDGERVLVGRQGALCGNVNYATGRFWASEHAVVVTPVSDIHVRWLGELLRSMNLNQYSIAAAQPGIAIDDIQSLEVARPPLHEQRAIADFLDVETAKLDTLVAKKRVLIERLKEKRGALISRTVTRGLPPEAARATGLKSNPKLKPSGIEWLGEIPEHWEVRRLKSYLIKMEQGWSPQCENIPAIGEEWGVLKVGAVNGWQFDSTENKRLPEGEQVLLEYEIRVGDFLVSRANTRELLGAAGLVRSLDSRLLLCDKLYRLKLNAGTLNPDFLFFFMRSKPGHFELEREATGASDSMQNISQGAVKNLWVTIPSHSEQVAIADYLDQETNKIDRMVAKVGEAVERLQEYRTALITAAVTGKIDVRGYGRGTEAA